jgi:hypothetical protein
LKQSGKHPKCGKGSLKNWYAWTFTGCALNLADMEPQPLLASGVDPSYKELTDDQSLKVLYMLQGMSQNGLLPHGAQTKIVFFFGVHRSTIQRLRARAKKAHADGLSMSPAVRSNKNQRGRHPIYDKDQIREHARLVPLQQRKSYRSLAANLGISHVRCRLVLQQFAAHLHSRGPSH